MDCITVTAFIVANINHKSAIFSAFLMTNDQVYEIKIYQQTPLS